MASLYQWSYRVRRPQRPPDFTSWPGGARLAVQLFMLHEWESTPTPVRAMPRDANTIDFLGLGVREYGAQFGFWRLMETLEKHDAKASIFVNGLTCALYPETIRAAHEAGHELANHTWDQSVPPILFKSRDDERDALRRTNAAIQELTGERVLGYCSPGPRPSPHTLELCAEEGFVWSADYNDSDIPYIMDVNGKPLVSVGYIAPGYTDNNLVQMGPPIGLQTLLTLFDVLYAESARRPMKLCYAFHSHTSGRPVMTNVLDQFLAHARRHEGVWLCRGIDMARYWQQVAGPPTSDAPVIQPKNP
jgi:peptidoglycan/xylan/chitin deacetylase (PgdA/CDA1 family)